MIGSTTFIVKSNGKYLVHIVGGGIYFPEIISQVAAKNNTTPFKSLSKHFKKFETDYDGIFHSSEDINAITSGRTCNPESPGYNKFAGDGFFLIDEDEKKVFHHNGTDGWKEF